MDFDIKRVLKLLNRIFVVLLSIGIVVGVAWNIVYLVIPLLVVYISG